MGFLLGVVIPITKSVPTTDLTSLITTVASSTAALVAIIGGFLVSRVISLSTENKGIKRRVDELMVGIGSKKAVLNSLKEWLFDFNVEDFVSRKRVELIVDEKSLEDVINETNFKGLSAEQLQPTFDRLVKIRGEMWSYIDEVIEHIEEHTFDMIKSTQHSMDLDHFEKEYEMFYTEIKYRLVKKIQIEENYPAPPPFIIAPSKNPLRYPNGMDYKAYSRKSDEKSEIETELRLLGSQHEEMLYLYKDYAKPKGVISGLAVLAYASVVSIVYPLTLLPYPVDYYNDTDTKWLILSFFFSQLLLLFSYLFWQVYSLTYVKEEF